MAITPHSRPNLLSRPNYYGLSLYSIAARWWIVIPKIEDSVEEIKRISQRLDELRRRDCLAAQAVFRSIHVRHIGLIVTSAFNRMDQKL